MKKILCWQVAKTPKELAFLLKELGKEYPIKIGRGKTCDLEFVKQKENKENYRIVKQKNGVMRIEYTKTYQVGRALGNILAGAMDSKTVFEEENPFKSLGIMLDCSRNAVVKVDHFKKWLRRIFLMGYNQAMLYTEDTYELPGEEYFGYLRGRYSKGELKELNDYAASFGIEMVGCIQTLGHLEQILKWEHYKNINDTGRELLVDEPKSYELIEKMIKFYQQTFSSQRIHVGIDEAHDLGRGKYMDKHGHKPQSELFNKHLNKVVRICKKYGLKPMIWSDMYFKMGKKPNYHYVYNIENKVSDYVVKKIPKNVDLVYWDYFNQDINFYKKCIQRHRQIGYQPIVASAAWTWKIPWCDYQATQDNAGACIKACKEARAQELFFTMWGDDGAYCDFNSAWLGLTYAAENIYQNRPREKWLAKKFEIICFGNYKAHVLASQLNNQTVQPTATLWDDPLLGIYWNNFAMKKNLWVKRGDFYKDLAQKLKRYVADKRAGDIEHAFLWAEILAKKIELRSKLVKAYRARNKRGLKQVQTKTVEMAGLIKRLSKLYRKNWYARNKPFGFEVIQVRLAGLVARFGELNQRIDELVSGKVNRIPELEEKIKGPTNIDHKYCTVATGSTGVFKGFFT